MKKTMCSGCKRYFTSTYEHQKHRTGKFNKTPSQRRCMTAEEMKAAGFVSERKVITDEEGRPERDVWYLKSRREAMRRTFATKEAEKASEVPPQG